MPVPPPPLLTVIDMTDSALVGAYGSFSSTTPIGLPLQTSTQGIPYQLRLVAPTGAGSPPWVDVTTTGAQFQLTVAQPGLPPVAGTNVFTLGVDGVTWSATVFLATAGMLTAFEYASSKSSLPFVFQVDVLFAGASSPVTVLYIPITIARSVTASGVIGYTPGIAEPYLGVPTSDGSLLTSTINGVRSWLASTSFGRSFLGLTNAAAGQTLLGVPSKSALGLFFPEDHGAVGDGATDDSAAFQAAVVACNAAGGGTVVGNPSRRYAIMPGVVDLLDYVTLDMGSQSETGGQVVTTGTGQPALAATSGGSTFVMLGGAGGLETDPPYVNLTGQYSSFLGCRFYDPDNVGTLTTPIAKPFAVKTSYDTTVDRIHLVNTYRGIYVTGGRTNISNVSGNPLLNGIVVDQAFDRPKIRNCHFIPSFVSGPQATWFAANSVAYVLRDVADLQMLECFTFGYNTGLRTEFSTISGNGAYGTLVACGFDCTTYGVVDAGTAYGLEYVGCQLIAGTNAYQSTAAKHGVTTFTGGVLRSGTGTLLASINGSSPDFYETSVKFHGTHFYPYVEGAVGIDVVGPVALDIFGNTFQVDGSMTPIRMNTGSSGATGRVKENAITPSGAAVVVVNNSGAAIKTDDAATFSTVNGNTVTPGTGTLTLGAHVIAATGAGALTVDGTAVGGALPSSLTGVVYATAGAPAAATASQISGLVTGDITPSSINTGTLLFDNGQSGTDGDGNLYVGGNIYPGVSDDGGNGLVGQSGASWIDNGSGGWQGPQNNSTINGDGSFTFDDGAIHSDGDGNIYVSSITAYASITAFSTNFVQFSSDNNSIYSDGDGNFYAAGNSIVLANYGSSFDYGQITTDGNGNLGAVTVAINGGFGLFGVGPPFRQPGTPILLSDVISILQIYGLCQ